MVIKSRRKQRLLATDPLLWFVDKMGSKKQTNKQTSGGKQKKKRFLQWSKNAGTPAKFRHAEVDLSELLAGCIGDGDERSWAAGNCRGSHDKEVGISLFKNVYSLLMNVAL